MLFADFQPPKNDADVGFMLAGAALSGVISGAIPFFTWMVMRQTALAIIGGLVSAGTGFLLGCCLGMPMSMIFTIVIVVVAQNTVRPMQSPFVQSPVEYDDYARPFQLPDREAPRGRIPYAEEVGGGDAERRRKPDRRQEAEDDWRRRAEEQGWRPPRGPRPKRDPDGGPWTGR
jgi:hypothetical protein